MTATEAQFSEADFQLIETDFRTLPELCAQRSLDAVQVKAMIDVGLMPQPAYTLPDGREMFPDDYFDLYDRAGGAESIRGYFTEHFAKAAREAGLGFTGGWNPDSEWTDYIDGTYWVCLRKATPEVIVEKEGHIRTIAGLVQHADPGSEQWRQRLRAAVDALDGIERPFTDFDRARWDYTSRERYITDVKRRYPEVFAPDA